jgi:hypothetical protein
MKQQERSQCVVTLLLGLAVVIVLIVIGISTLNRFNPNEPFPAQSTGIPTTVVVSTVTPLIPDTQTPDMSGTQTTTFRLTEKAIKVATMKSLMGTPFDTQTPVPTGTDESERINATGEKMWGLDVLNGWFGLIDGNDISFYAGSLLEDPEQGAIAFLIREPHRSDDQKILTPTRHGGVRVVAEQNNRLTLQAVDGEIFYFDVPARRFVASLTEVVPTVTLLPTLTPPTYAVETPMPTYNPYPAPTEPGTEAP